jgi:hypothetical protein
VHRRRLAQVQQHRQPLRVLAVVLVLRPEDQPQLTGVPDEDTGHWRLKHVVVAAVAAAGLVAGLEAVGEAGERSQHVLDASHL